ncbi:MAG: type IX secretion system sortase PorU [Bacteroidota bacterium]|nr:type IX secretion system sortase PorU [Bacteroidota bacterium]
MKRKYKIKFLIGIALAAFHVFAFSISAQESNIRILQSDERGLTFEFTPKFHPISIVAGESETFTSITFDGEGTLSSTTPGEPLLKFRNISLRLPGLSNHSVEILETDYETIPDILLAPVPNVYKDEQGNYFSKLIKDLSAYSATDFLPSEIVKLTDIGTTRGAALGNIHIYPLQYNPSAKQLRKYTRLKIKVIFGSSELAGISQPEDELLKGVGINYETGKHWYLAPAFAKKQAQTNSVLANGTWFRFPINEDGIYKLTGSQLISIGVPANTNPNTIKIYNNGGFEPAFDPLVVAPDDLLENAIFVNNVGNPNELDSDDYILFYGKGTTGWKYNAPTKTFSHYINRFAAGNVYWLTFDGAASKKMLETESLNATNFYQPASVLGKTFREDEKVNILNSGMEWLGQQFSVNDSITYVVPLPGLDTQSPVSYKIRLAARTHNSWSYFTASDRQQNLGTVSIEGTYIGSYGSPQAKFATLNRTLMPNLGDPRSELKLKFTSDNPAGSGYLDWFEIFYRQSLNSQNDIFNFHTHDTTAIVKYAIGGFSSNDIKVFDVSDFANVKIITSPSITSNTVSFQIQTLLGTPKELFAVGQNGYKTPGNFVRMNNQNIHSAVTSGDSIPFIIIMHKDFKAAANRLKTHREKIGADRLQTLVVDVEELYNEFGGGLSSPIAIRNFLKYAYNSIPGNSLKYVLLFGDGDFDYKRITTTGTNWIPPWETPESYTDINSFATEDRFAIFDNRQRVAFAIGRLAVRSASEASVVVDKIIEYENSPALDPWKMRITYVADDGPAAPGDDDGAMHTTHAEAVAAVTPNSIEKRKIYIVEYPTVITSIGRRKPAANQAIVSQMNTGSLVVNFSGHGNPRLWTHEQVFVRETDFQLLNNKGRYFYLVAATCNFSEFDGVGDQSGGEILVNKPNSGAIGVLAATRAVYAYPNRELNIKLFEQTFKLDTYGNIIPSRLGDGIFKAKQILPRDDNHEKFFLLGDPSVRLALPKVQGSIDSINSQFANQRIDLNALQKITLKGTIREPGTNLPSNFSGKAQVVVYDANKKINVPEWTNFSYTASGSVIFRGESSISNGLFKTEFIIPKDISYDTLNGRITLYFSNNETDGMGYTENFRIIGTDTTAVTDNEGPKVDIFFDSKSFRPGDIVSESPLLIVDLQDESGINASGSGIGHRIEAWLNDQSESTDLTPFYKSNLDTYQEGVVEYKFGKLAAGSHKIKIRAWDIFNNASSGETIFDVLVGQGLTITDLFNYPNPFSENTLFTFHQNQIVPVDVEIKIYSIAGRLLESIKRSGITENFIRIEWNGRDRDGDKLANGIYLYKVIVKTQDGRFTSESIGKLSVLK